MDSDDERRAKRLEYKRRYHEAHKEEDNARMREYRKKNKDKIRGYIREWRKNNPERLKYHHDKSQKKYIEKNKDIAVAHSLVHKAVESGLLIRNACEICGEEKTEAHHDDYNKPLKVRWLCKKCHVEWHKNNKPIRREK